MRAVSIRRFGAPDGMAVVDVAAPEPTATQVLIATEAIGVGGVDAVIRRGTLGTGWPVGMIPGSEVAGTVVAGGSDVDRSWIGRRVWAFTGTSGGYAGSAVAEAADIAALPDGLSPVDAVAVGSAATVAALALDHGHLAPGESVLVRGAAGSIGLAAVEHAVRRGAARVAVTTASAERGRRLRGLGATVVLDRDGGGDDDAAEYDVVLDVVGGPRVPAFVDRLASNGRLVLVGAVAGLPPADFGAGLLRSFQRSRSVSTFSLASVPPGTLRAARAEQLAAVVRGDLHPVVHAVLPLERAADAHRMMDAGEVFGRVVLQP